MNTRLRQQVILNLLYLDLFGDFIQQALDTKLNKHLGHSRYDFRHKITSN